jgi:putative hydrolase of HD superfamily
MMQQVVDFVLELDKLKAIERKVRPTSLARYENSAEHSWQLTLFALTLASCIASAIDVNRVIRMLLVHDVGEIDIGDTMVFVEGGWEQRKADELQAVKRIFSLLPEGRGNELISLWHEFELGATAEARFAQAVDRAMPVLLNLQNGGGSWLEHGITYDRVVKRIEQQINAGCPELWAYLAVRLNEARARGFFSPD